MNAAWRKLGRVYCAQGERPSERSWRQPNLFPAGMSRGRSMEEQGHQGGHGDDKGASQHEPPHELHADAGHENISDQPRLRATQPRQRQTIPPA